MIAPISFTKEWVSQHKKEKAFAKINPPILEKMIHALALLEALVIYKLNFTFKGGTSLILLVPEPRRFSVDIDILTEHSQADLEKAFTKITRDDTFSRWELDESRSYKPGVPKAHYIFYYNSQLNRQAGFILLDILFEKHQYPVINSVPIHSSWIKSEGEPIYTQVPSIESILGDKLTAFAPNTTGVPYGKNKSLEIVKQLYDVGHLFDYVKDFRMVANSFIGIVAQEIKYRKLAITSDQVLDDSIETALLVGKTEKHHTEPEKLKYDEIKTGLEQFGNFLMTGNFYIDHAIECAAKVAYLSAKIKLSDNTPLQKYGEAETVFQFESMPYNTLNRLRKFKNGSLFYWSKAAELLQLN